MKCRFLNIEMLTWLCISHSKFSHVGLKFQLMFCGFCLQFCSEDWSEDMEKELCLLWDMTFEADVAELLMQHDFLDLTSRIIHDTTIPRLVVSCDGSVQNNSDLVYSYCSWPCGWHRSVKLSLLVWLLEFIGHHFADSIQLICTFKSLLSP
jgi:hypothetical protein